VILFEGGHAGWKRKGDPQLCYLLKAGLRGKGSSRDSLTEQRKKKKRATDTAYDGTKGKESERSRAPPQGEPGGKEKRTRHSTSPTGNSLLFGTSWVHRPKRGGPQELRLVKKGRSSVGLEKKDGDGHG